MWQVDWVRSGRYAESGKEITFKLHSIFKYNHERIAEVTIARDAASLMQQIGVEEFTKEEREEMRRKREENVIHALKLFEDNNPILSGIQEQSGLHAKQHGMDALQSIFNANSVTYMDPNEGGEFKGVLVSLYQDFLISVRAFV